MITITDTRVVGHPKENVVVGLTLRTPKGREYSVLHGDSEIISAGDKQGDSKLWELGLDPPHSIFRFKSFEELCAYLMAKEKDE